MFTLLMILVVACVITRWIGTGSCRYDRSLGRARRESWRLDDGSAHADRHAGSARASTSSASVRPISVETPLEKLQRDFATGTITVEQYEHEVGKLYGVRGEA